MLEWKHRGPCCAPVAKARSSALVTSSSLLELYLWVKSGLGNNRKVRQYQRRPCFRIPSRFVTSSPMTWKYILSRLGVSQFSRGAATSLQHGADKTEKSSCLLIPKQRWEGKCSECHSVQYLNHAPFYSAKYLLPFLVISPDCASRRGCALGRTSCLLRWVMAIFFPRLSVVQRLSQMPGYPFLWWDSDWQGGSSAAGL